MTSDLADLGFRDTTYPTARLLAVLKHPAVGILGVLTVVGVVALPNPLPELPVALYAFLGMVEGIGLAVTAENLVFRPTKRFRLRRAVRFVVMVAGAVLTFVMAMAVLGVALTLRDWALLGGFCVSVPVSLSAIDFLKDRVRAELESSSTP
ncbi:hypothetical protein [Haladaptatus sp. DFWS20]|uniref:hypothetical protein n=1 Tax=Haladaptatus sp. DFWS20 TaxID=3403467 RepID=UPI003EC148CB